MSSVNLFKYYRQKENHFTNGLVSILELSMLEDKCFVCNFLKNTLSLDIQKDSFTFKVLSDISGTADAEISNDELCCLLETKIVSGTIKEDQIRSHLKHLDKYNQNIKKLVLLTPNDPNSQYVKDFININPNKIDHLAWQKVYFFFNEHAEGKKDLLSEIMRQYSEKISEDILKIDYAGVICKIQFSTKSGVNSETYLDKMRKRQWTDWHTPRVYKKLDGTGRKLLLYDPKRQAITVEVEISKVEETNEQEDYPISNKFVPRTLKVYEEQIPVEKIRKIVGLENFGVYRKDRSAYRNLTREQYIQLTKDCV